MLFNSLDFAIFLPVVFVLYWFFTNKNLGFQNALIVISSYVFYGWWNWIFLFLIFFSTIVDYVVGIQLVKASSKKNKKLLLLLSICVNLGLLGFFKYYNFFVDNFVTAFSFFGYQLGVQALSIVLPVGISFYTFQTMSYTIDVYRGNLKPTKDFVAFAAFVSFFPQLVAGPIERATNLLPQISKKRSFDYNEAMDGIYQILWGLFKKVVIADNAAELVNLIFAEDHYKGSVLLLGAVLFAFQIYGDFSGYSDIAIGVSKLFGIKLMTNFKFPYFSRDIAEFWRRWHISLSTWFRDYLYIPLGGSKKGKLISVRNTFIIFIVSGFWHGANWTFVFWGFLNALYFLPLLLTKRNRSNMNVIAEEGLFPSLKGFVSVLITFCLTTIAWVFFRAESMGDAIGYLRKMVHPSLLSIPRLSGVDNTNMFIILLLVVLMVVLEWYSRKKEFVFQHKYKQPLYLQVITVSALVTLLYFFSGNQQDFIYFQF